MLGFGVRKDSPVLASGRTLGLRDFASWSFLHPAAQYNEHFLDDFREICAEEGFVPRIEFVPRLNQLEFYAMNPGDGAFFITRMAQGGHTAFDFYVKKNLKVICPGYPDRPYYVNAFLLTRKGERSRSFAYFLRRVEEMERAALGSGDDCPFVY